MKKKHLQEKLGVEENRKKNLLRKNAFISKIAINAPF